jgi:endonuclease/exonuclease/phosphatase family metal-dependent hydrolase
VTRALTVATWNIFAGRTWNGSRVDLDLTLAVLRRLDADLVAVQEVDRDQARSHRADQARLLGEALGMEWRYAPALLGTPGSPEGWRAPAAGNADPGGTAYGIALLSRLPLERVETVPLPRSGRDEPRVALVAGLADGGRRLTVAGTHLSFVPGPNLGQLRAIQRHLDGLGGPRLLLGDLNLSWPAVRLLSLPGWRPLVRGGTFPNRPPRSPAPRVQFDHVLAAGAAASLHPRGARIVTGPASDHRAVVVELEWS